MKTAGARKIVIDYEYGDSKINTQQATMFNQAVAGNTIIVLEMSRLRGGTQGKREPGAEICTRLHLLVKEYHQLCWWFPKALAMPRINYPSVARNNY